MPLIEAEHYLGGHTNATDHGSQGSTTGMVQSHTGWAGGAQRRVCMLFCVADRARGGVGDAFGRLLVDRRIHGATGGSALGFEGR